MVVYQSTRSPTLPRMGNLDTSPVYGKNALSSMERSFEATIPSTKGGRDCNSIFFRLFDESTRMWTDSFILQLLSKSYQR